MQKSSNQFVSPYFASKISFETANFRKYPTLIKIHCSIKPWVTVEHQKYRLIKSYSFPTPISISVPVSNDAAFTHFSPHRHFLRILHGRLQSDVRVAHAFKASDQVFDSLAVPVLDSLLLKHRMNSSFLHKDYSFQKHLHQWRLREIWSRSIAGSRARKGRSCLHTLSSSLIPTRPLVVTGGSFRLDS